MNKRSALAVVTATLAGICVVLSTGNSYAQSAEEAAVIAANNEFYRAFSTLDASAMDKVWAHKPYIVWIPPNVKEPMIGWTEQVQPGFAHTVAALKHIGITPVRTQVHVDGSMAWAVGGEEVDSNSALKDGTLISARPTLVTNVFEKDPNSGRWLLVIHHAQEPSQ